MAKPRVTGTTHELPFEKLSPRDFERMCLWLVRREGYPTAEHHGAAGSDRGRDLVAQTAVGLVAFQCKREKQFGPAKAEEAVRKIFALIEDPDTGESAEGPIPAKVLLLVACDVGVAAREKAVKAALETPVEVWARTELDERVKKHPAVVEEYFQLLPDKAIKKAQRRRSELEWFAAQWLRFFSAFRRRYYRRIRARHQTFNVQGIQTRGAFPLELEQVFVDLKVSPQSLHDLSPDLLRSQSLTGKRSIWELLLSRHAAFRNLVIVGPPGAGKTTLLQHLALVLAGNQQRKHQRRCPAFVPILLLLRQHVHAISTSCPPTLAEIVTAIEVEAGLRPPEDYFDRMLLAGKALVLLDGLDEVVGAGQRRLVVDWVERQIERYSDSRFVITSRPHGYKGNPLSRATVLEVQPFTLEQVEHFVVSLYTAYEALGGSDNEAEIGQPPEARDLIQQLRRSPPLAALLVNPLLLTMVVMVHRHRGQLPLSRVDLYAEISNVLLDHWQEAKNLPLRLTPKQSHGFLQRLAVLLMIGKQQEFTAAEAASLAKAEGIHAEDALKGIQKLSGLILERETGSYSFAHLSFQEYFAAASFQKEDDLSLLLMWVNEPWWRETIRLYAARSDATPIIRACLYHPKPTLHALLLAYECSIESESIDTAVIAEMKNQLLSWIEDPKLDRQKLAAEVMLEIRLRELQRTSAASSVDRSYISCVEYQIFIDEMLAAGDHKQPDHWRDSHFPKGAAQEPIAGVRYSDATDFCEWLNERRPETGTLFRLPDPDEALEIPTSASGNWFEALADESVGTWIASARPSVVGLPSEAQERIQQTKLRILTGALEHDLDRIRVRDRITYEEGQGVPAWLAEYDLPDSWGRKADRNWGLDPKQALKGQSLLSIRDS